jgi:hypothetical protein
MSEKIRNTWGRHSCLPSGPAKPVRQAFPLFPTTFRFFRIFAKLGRTGLPTLVSYGRSRSQGRLGRTFWRLWPPIVCLTSLPGREMLEMLG